MLADEIEKTLRKIEQALRANHPDGIPAEVRMAELSKIYSGFSFTIYPTDPMTGKSHIDVVPSNGAGFRIVIPSVKQDGRTEK